MLEEIQGSREINPIRAIRVQGMESSKVSSMVSKDTRYNRVKYSKAVVAESRGSSQLPLTDMLYLVMMFLVDQRCSGEAPPETNMYNKL